MGRTIGIRHRIKRTAEGEARPTQIAIRENETVTLYDLEEEMLELDFVLGRFPIEWKKVEVDDDLMKFPAHHVRYRKLRMNEVAANFPEAHLREEDGVTFVASHIPVAYDGLRPGDTVAMVLGGSGDMLAYALARQADIVGAKVIRVPTFILKSYRPDDNKDADASLLASLAESSPEIFYGFRPRDAKLILVRETLRRRTDCMKARIGCDQRLRQRLIGSILMSEKPLSVEGSIEKLFDARKSNDRISQALSDEESAAERELESAVRDLDVYKRIFEPIEGVGPKIASRIIAAVIDIRRFETKGKLKVFAGAHVLADGRFPRRRTGSVANWHPDFRQALYLVGEQFNRRPNTVWGVILRGYKKKLREVHPEVVLGEGGKKRYTNGHIHKMALWRTLTKFVEWLHREWWRLEGRKMDRPTVPDCLAWINPAMYAELVEREGYSPDGLVQGNITFREFCGEKKAA